MAGTLGTTSLHLPSLQDHSARTDHLFPSPETFKTSPDSWHPLCLFVTQNPLAVHQHTALIPVLLWHKPSLHPVFSPNPSVVPWSSWTPNSNFSHCLNLIPGCLLSITLLSAPGLLCWHQADAWGSPSSRSPRPRCPCLPSGNWAACLGASWAQCVLPSDFYPCCFLHHPTAFPLSAWRSTPSLLGFFALTSVSACFHLGTYLKLQLYIHLLI